MRKEKPILFNSQMVNAILDGRKTQTRRIIKGLEYFGDIGDENNPCAYARAYYNSYYNLKNDWRNPNDREIDCPQGQVGEELWVRETWGTRYRYPFPPSQLDKKTAIFYKADTPQPHVDVWTPSIFMPRWASRIQLRITDIRVERLNDISEEDAIKEGIHKVSKDGEMYKYGFPDIDGLPGRDNLGWHWGDWCLTAKLAFRRLWILINGDGGWDKNPWVWVVEFERIKE